LLTFDAERNWRVKKMVEDFVNPANQHVEKHIRVKYDPARRSDFDLEESVAPNLEAVVLRYRVRAVDEEAPSLAEFLPETYGVNVGTSVKWWQKPPIWFAILAAVSFALVVWIRIRTQT
jgi:hypothetical protein